MRTQTFAKEELIRAEGDDKLASDKLKSLGDRKAALISEKENADGRIMLFEEADKKASRESDAVQNQINDVEAKLGEISNGVDELTQKRETVRKRSEEINLELVTLAKDTEAAKLAVDELELRKSTQSDRVKSITDEIEQYEAKNQNLMLSISDVQSTVNELRAKAKSADDAIRDRITYRDNCEKRNVELRTEEKTKTSDREKLSAELVRLEERKNNMQKEFDDLNDMLFEQYELTRPEAEALGIVIENMAEAKKRLHEIKVAIRALGSINVGAIEEYKEVSERYEFLKEQIGDIEKSKSELQNIIEDLTSSMSEKFLRSSKKSMRSSRFHSPISSAAARASLFSRNPTIALNPLLKSKFSHRENLFKTLTFSRAAKNRLQLWLCFSACLRSHRHRSVFMTRSKPRLTMSMLSDLQNICAK